MEIREDRWLSSIFDHSVFKIEVDPSASAGHGSDLSEVIRRHASQQRRAFYYSKIDTAQAALARQLSLAGLYVVDVNVIFRLTPARLLTTEMASGTERYSVREITPAQYDEVLQIAGSCFTYSRFHLDPLVSLTTANQVKREWIQSYINKQRGDRLFVACVGPQPAGFLAALASESAGQKIRTIDLVGVGNAFQRQGVGQSLVSFFINHYRNQCDYFEVGTQIANIPSMRLYQGFGFELARSQYVLHMSIPGKDQSN